MKLIDPYDEVDPGVLRSMASHSANDEGGHHVPLTTVTIDRDYDPARDDTTTFGDTSN